ncbi:hypothetical protein [Tuwongella immobilis]|uniref:Lipoprotein n=1 Tax=Tuwongella immobilis TaxID=692036 RepID=A0A6C2YW37_9BACT|nr:hypothetical protein [Tuwongella immobilis]VIP05726.1 unnamed protein product [Tuwongella immobilis]VTS08808.1 unnamed protein product [Tuwongella immobilis]
MSISRIVQHRLTKSINLVLLGTPLALVGCERPIPTTSSVPTTAMSSSSGNSHSSGGTRPHSHGSGIPPVVFLPGLGGGLGGGLGAGAGRPVIDPNADPRSSPGGVPFAGGARPNQPGTSSPGSGAKPSGSSTRSGFGGVGSVFSGSSS